MNINSVLNTINQLTAQTQKNQKISTDSEEEVGKVESEVEKLEAFKKEVWDEIESMPWKSSISVSIQITDKAFERMMSDDEFKNKMMNMLREEAVVGRPPIVSCMDRIDENGYSGYSCNDTAVGNARFSVHSKDKDSFYAKKAKKQDNPKDYWEEEYFKKKMDKEIMDEQYEQSLHLKNVFKHKEEIAEMYEKQTIKD